MSYAVVLSCEHARNHVPARYRALFNGHEPLLETHRAYDPGALAVGRLLARRLKTPLFSGTTTRLLVDLNRSPDHPRLFSELTRTLPVSERERLLRRYYYAHRRRVEAFVRTALRRRKVVHLAVHSFVPVLAGRSRKVDVGLLYDPASRFERESCRYLAMHLRRAAPDLRIRRNAPYLGVSDGLTTYLRRLLPATRYAGIELEVNQRFADDGDAIARIAALVASGIDDLAHQ